MNTISEKDLINALEWRYAVKVFDPNKKIPAHLWAALEKSLVLTPSSYGLQPWKFIVVENKEIREKLFNFSWKQKQVTDSSHFLVLTRLKGITENYVHEYMQLISQIRKTNIEKLSGYEKMIIGDVVHGERSKQIEDWASRQCYIALGNFMTAAALLGIDTCPMEGIEPKKYDEILSLHASEYRTVLACAAGYRSETDALSKLAKVRFPSSKIITKI